MRLRWQWRRDAWTGDTHATQALSRASLSKSAAVRGIGGSRNRCIGGFGPAIRVAIFTVSASAIGGARAWRRSSKITGRSLKRGSRRNPRLSAVRLLEEIRADGYRGGYSQLKAFVPRPAHPCARARHPL